MLLTIIFWVKVEYSLPGKSSTYYYDDGFLYRSIQLQCHKGVRHMQSVSFTTDVVSSHLDQGEVYNIM